MYAGGVSTAVSDGHLETVGRVGAALLSETLVGRACLRAGANGPTDRAYLLAKLAASERVSGQHARAMARYRATTGSARPEPGTGGEPAVG